MSMFDQLDPQWSAPAALEKALERKHTEVHKLTCECGKCDWLIVEELGKKYKFRGIRRAAKERAT
jgi:hypothetical protein